MTIGNLNIGDTFTFKGMQREFYLVDFDKHNAIVFDTDANKVYVVEINKEVEEYNPESVTKEEDWIDGRS